MMGITPRPHNATSPYGVSVMILRKDNPHFGGPTQLSPCGPIPHNLAQGFDAPPTLERSGPEHRVGRFPSSSLRGEDREERWSLP